MEGSIVNAGLSGSDLTQTFPSITVIARETQVTAQRPEAASSVVQKPETSATTRQEKPPKGLVQEMAFANAIAEFLNQKVSFRYDDRIGQIVVKVTRGGTEEVIRQIPAEEMIEMIAKFRKDFRGLIFNRTG